MCHIQKPLRGYAVSVLNILLLYQSRLSSVKKEVYALKESLQTRKKVEQAKGFLMKQLGIDEAEAYRSMQKESMNRGISMKELAQAIIIAYKG